jgi:hypothetical protein
VLLIPDVSKEHVAFIFRGHGVLEEGVLLIFLDSVLKITYIVWNHVSLLLSLCLCLMYLDGS